VGTTTKAEAARDLLEIVVEKVPEVDFTEEAGFILGENGQQIRELQVHLPLPYSY
jgi:hypothetical protein